MIDQVFNNFFNFELDEIDCYSLCNYFIQSESSFKEKFISNAPQKIIANNHNLTISNLKKLKDPDAKHFIKYLYYQVMIKRHIINQNIFDDTFFNLILLDKDFEKNFYHVIGETDSQNIILLLKEIANKKNITFLESLKDAFIVNTANYFSKTSSPARRENTNYLDLSIKLLSLEEIFNFYLLLLDSNKQNTFSSALHRLDRILFKQNFELNDSIKYLNYFKENNLFDKIFKKCEDKHFFQEMQITNLFNLIIDNKFLDLVNNIFLLCKKHKDCYYIENYLTTVLSKKIAFAALVEIGDQGSINRFIENNHHLDEIKKILIYS